MRWGWAVSAMGQTGQSEAIHSPEAWASVVVKLTMPAGWSIAVVCKVAISCCPSVLRTMSRPLERGAYRKLRSPSPGWPVRMVAVSDFSGLTSSAWALAKAEASAATDSLDRGMDRLRFEHVKAHRSRFRALGFHAMPDGLPRILRHQGFELAFRSFVVEKGAPGIAEERCEFRPGVGRAHIDDADGLDAWTRRLGQDEVGDFARLHTAPEFLFRRYEDGELKWVHGNRDLHPFAPASDDREHRGTEVGDPHVVLQLRHVFFGGGLFGEGPRQHELGLEHRLRALHDSVEGGHHPRNCRMPDPALHVADPPAGVALIPGAIELLRRPAKLHDEVAGEVLRLGFTPFLPPKADKGGFIATHDDTGV